MKKIFVVGIGPGDYESMTIKAAQVLDRCDVIVGYTVYVELVRGHFPGKEFVTTPMGRETERCHIAFEQASSGKTTAMICSGDSGVYGMSGLMLKIGTEYPDVEVEIVSGVTAATAGAAVLGAPLIHDFAVISLSDLLTPWEKIEKRLLAASQADFVICLYNPSSKKRHDYLQKACDLMLRYKSEETVCGTVSRIGRTGEQMKLLTLAELRQAQTDMFTTVFVGNSQTRIVGGRMVTPRGYETKDLSVMPGIGVFTGKHTGGFLIFGGTSEGRALAEFLSYHEIPATLCVATEYGEEVLPKELPGIHVRTGRMDETEMEKLFLELCPLAVVDATHPYAREVTENIRLACEKTGQVYHRLLRQETSLQDFPELVIFDDCASAADWLEEQRGNILLTTGMKELPEFAARLSEKSRIYARVLLQENVLALTEQLGLAKKQILCMQGPFSKEMNVATLHMTNAAFLVTKESGQNGGFAQKAEAARDAGAVCVVIRRPVKETGESFEEICDILLECWTDYKNQANNPICHVNVTTNTSHLGDLYSNDGNCGNLKSVGQNFKLRSEDDETNPTTNKMEENLSNLACSLENACDVEQDALQAELRMKKTRFSEADKDDEKTKTVPCETDKGNIKTRTVPCETDKGNIKTRTVPCETDKEKVESKKLFFEAGGEDAKEKSITLIGIGMGGANQLTLEAVQACENADCIIGASRMLDSLAMYSLPMIPLYKAEEIVDFIIRHPRYQHIVVAFSGDVGFYSGARKLHEKLEDSSQLRAYGVHQVSGISSVSYFAARLGLPWEDMVLVSTHGREQNLVGAVRKNKKVFTLASDAKSIRVIAEKLDSFGLGSIRMHVGANLSYPDERIDSGSVRDFLTYDKRVGICVAIFENPLADDESCVHGIPDASFVRGKVPMTKEEVRSISVSKLQPKRDSIVYDIGAGTGSVAVECARMADRGRVYAVEWKEDAWKLVAENRKRFAVSNLEIVAGHAPEALENLPAPTHAFIGGSGGEMKRILSVLLKKNPHVRVVVNCITLETVAETLAAAGKLGMTIADIVSVSIAKSKEVGDYHMMMAQNPVYVIVLTNRCQ